MNQSKRCVICGIEFIPHTNRQNQCNSTECKKAYRKISGKYRFQDPVITNEISKIVEQARKVGMSYGQYVGYVSCKIR